MRVKQERECKRMMIRKTKKEIMGAYGRGLKRTACILLCVGMIGVTTGCGNSTGGDEAANRSAGKTTGVSDVLQAGIEKNNAANAGDVKSTGNESTGNESTGNEIAGNDGTEGAGMEKAGGADENKVVDRDARSAADVDLTKLSSTMVYSEVYNMMNKPDDYMGKVIKIDGQYAVYHDEYTGANYFACIIQDATACCAQGMEFVLQDEYIYPQDYPEEGENIVVMGVYDTYMEGDYKYCTLRDAVLVD